MKKEHSKNHESENNLDNETTVFDENDYELTTKKEDSLCIWKEKIKNFGLVGFGIGFAWLGCLFNIFFILFLASAALGMIGTSIYLFQDGRILVGIGVLLVGTPLAVGLAGWLFPFWIFLSVISLAVWGTLKIFSVEITFEDISSYAWLIVILLVFLFLLFSFIKDLFSAIRNQQAGKFLKEFFKKNWFYVLLIAGFLYLAFS